MELCIFGGSIFDTKEVSLTFGIASSWEPKERGRGRKMQFSCFSLFFCFLLFLVVTSHHIAKNILKKIYILPQIPVFFIMKNSPKEEFLIIIAKFHLNCLEHEGELKVLLNFHI